MKHEDSVIISYLAKASSRLINEMASKHEDGEFLPEITLKNPHLHKLKSKLLASYCDLIIEIGSICQTYELSKQEARKQFKAWVKNLERSKSLEHKLYFDSLHIDIGGDH